MKFSTIALVTTVAMAGALPAHADALVALTGDRDLAMIDAESGAVSGTVTVSGVEGRLLGVDVRPADGMLYGLFADGTLATIDPASGNATEVSKLSTMLADGVAATVDFNPVADRLRVMGSDGASLRVNVDTGEVTEDGRHAYAEADMHKGETPNVIAGAYTNSYAGTEATKLYNIDGTIGALVLQDPPNDGVLNAVGKLGFDVTEVGFDIASDGQGGNSAWLVSGDTLYEVNLETGAATEAGKIEGGPSSIRDLAIMPAM